MANSRLDLEQKKPLTSETSIQDRLTVYNQHSLVWEDEERIIYLFDYSKGSGRGELINRHVLRKLKEKGHWGVVRHPLVLNYINEKCLSCTGFYALHTVLYFTFLFLLYSYVHGRPTVGKNLCVTAIILFFIFFLLVKAALKLQNGLSSISFWFVSSYLFNISTYAVTLFYVWSFYFFNFDNYHEEVKKTVSWFMPIIAILASWINCLYVLRKAPCGPYILMMSKILFSFLNTTIIWIPTLLCFAFAFQLIMRDSGTQPWDDAANGTANGTGGPSILMAILQSFTKTTAMMIGEVEANDILERKTWIANLLLIFFEIITVILLMNLMISLAVGDVNELRLNAEERLLKIKLNFCIEALHLSEQVTLLDGLACIRVLHRSPTNNVLVIHKNSGDVYSTYIPAIKGRFFNETTDQQTQEHAHMRMETAKDKGATHGHSATRSVSFASCEIFNASIQPLKIPPKPSDGPRKGSLKITATTAMSSVNTSQPSSTSAYHEKHPFKLRYLSPSSTITSSSFYSVPSMSEHSGWREFTAADPHFACLAEAEEYEDWTTVDGGMSPSSSSNLQSYRTALDFPAWETVGAEKDMSPLPHLHDSYKNGSIKTYDFMVTTTGLRVRKEALTNRATLMSLQGMTLHLVETTPSGIDPVQDPEHIKELQLLKDEESRWRKFERWLMGLNWKALLAI
ncbi:transient receptor potential cation channel subfamily A member 1 like protein [Ditylenchus destructor]|nr:transient receptor potential cation channel subfamily A member 1 like protein [Ditylenchus destructor]